MAIPTNYLDFVKRKLAKSLWQSSYETEAVYVIRNFFQDVASAPDSFSIVDIPADGDMSQFTVKLTKLDGKITFAISYVSTDLKYGKKRLEQTFNGIDVNSLIVENQGFYTLNPNCALPDGVTADSIRENLLHSFEQIRHDQDNPYPVFLRGGRARERGIRFAMQCLFSKVYDMPSAKLSSKDYPVEGLITMPTTTMTLPVIDALSLAFPKVDTTVDDPQPRPFCDVVPASYVCVPIADETLDAQFASRFKWRDLIWQDAQQSPAIAGVPVVYVKLETYIDGFQNVYLSVIDLRGNTKVRLLLRNAFNVPLETERIEISNVMPSAQSHQISEQPQQQPQKRPQRPQLNPEFPYNTIVLDTNSILTLPKLIPTLLAKKIRFIVPLMVFHELNKRRINTSLSADDKKRAAQALKTIANADPELCRISTVNYYADKENLPEDLRNMVMSNDLLILLIAIRHASRGKSVALITADGGLRTTCDTVLNRRPRVTAVLPADALAAISALPVQQ